VLLEGLSQAFDLDSEVSQVLARGDLRGARVFVSYAWGQALEGSVGRRPLQEKALALARIFERAGATAWLDTSEMCLSAQGDGNDIDEAMMRGIDSCTVFLCCFSAAYATSANCKREFQYAENTGKNILFANVGEPGFDARQMRGWILMALGKRLWADCRTHAALVGRDGAVLCLKKAAEQHKMMHV